MSEGTSVRLSKAAREFNVGTNTIVEFLSKKGHQIDPSPNTKLTTEMYSMLLKEYQTEKQVKAVSQKIGIEYSGRKTITAEEVLKKDFEQEEEEDFDSDELIIKNIKGGFIEKPKVQPEVKAKPVVAEEIIVEKTPEKPIVEAVVPEPPVKEEPIVSIPKAEVPVTVEVEVAEKTVEVSTPVVLQEAATPSEDEATDNKIEVPKTGVQVPMIETVVDQSATAVEGELKILGKIDLDSLNLRTKPDRKTKAQRQKEEEDRRLREKEQKQALENKKRSEAAPIAKVEVAPSVEPLAKPEIKPDVKPLEEQKIEVKSEERPVNFMPTDFRKLEGVTIVDKIVLPEDRRNKAKPVASSSEDKLSTAQKKKKRKRIKGKGQGDAAATPSTVAPNTTGSTSDRPVTPYTQRDTKRGKPAPPPVRKDEKVEVTEEDIQRKINETLARMTPVRKSKTSKHRRQKRDAVSSSMASELARQQEGQATIQVTEFVTANELATMMNVPVIKVISTCMALGMVVSINQRLDAETLSLVAEEFGFQVDFVSHELQDSISDEEEVFDPADVIERAPIVTVMGHVDHGKTLLLDYIRKSNVIAGEAGGITQHIGAYEVFTENGKKIAFLDTPGHEAFTAMRARGAKLTDVAIIVIAADDSVMPQTKEAINHAQAAGVSIVFAFNKIDKPSSNTEKIREQLAQMNILVEDWGGKYQCQEVSAKTGKGVDLLLEKVLLEAEILDLKGNPKRMAKGTVIESALDKGRGYVAKILVQDGTLRPGDIVLAGSVFGKVKAMFNERNKQIKEAGPSTPTLMLGLNAAPQAGDSFIVMSDEKEAKSVAARRQQLQREQGLRTQKHITLDEIGRRIAIGDFKELNLIVKADVDGSVEALSDSLLKLSTNEVQVNVIHKSVGAITESDIMLASASNAIVIGFQVRPSMQARKLAETEEIDIRLYSIIYNAIEEIKAAIIGMLSPVIEEVIVSNIEIREVFRITKVGTVAGCMVLDGKITRNTKIRIIRDGIVIYTGNLGSLKRFKDDVKDVSAGYECGLNIDGFNDIKVGDIIEGYTEREVVRKV